MGTAEEFTSMRSLAGALARAMNLVNPEIEHHHEQTAYLTYLIGQEMGMPQPELILAVYAALLHDIGSIVVEQPQSVAEIEANAWEVSAAGARILQGLPGFDDVAQVVRYCQCNWAATVACAIEEGTECERLGRASSVVHLADVVVTLLESKGETPVLNRAPAVRAAVKQGRGSEFMPEAVDAFLRVSEYEFMWLDVTRNPQFLLLFTGDIERISLKRTVELTELMSRIIDYRSPFTARHSAGVAVSAFRLAQKAGFSLEECRQMKIAGNLHDVGKLMVPRAILEKPGKLTDEEFNVVREHPYFTRLVLMDVEGFDRICNWAGYHHEKLNGKGYPFHFPAHLLDDGARILAVADIFSAITEDRPYRAGMTREQALGVLQHDVEAGGICGDVVALLAENYEEIDEARASATEHAGVCYRASVPVAA